MSDLESAKLNTTDKSPPTSLWSRGFIQKGAHAVWRVFSVLFTVIMLSLLILSVYSLFAKRDDQGNVSIAGFYLMTTLTDSMEPAISAGDLLVSKTGDFSDAKVGDIITYLAYDGSSSRVTHRVVDKTDNGLITQGDAVGEPDRIAVTTSMYIGKMVLRIPRLGKLIGEPSGLFFLAVIFLIYTVLEAVIKDLLEKRRLKMAAVPASSEMASEVITSGHEDEKIGPMGRDGFDNWSDSYDADVKESEAENEYPFEAYSAVLNKIYQLIDPVPSMKLLDVGIGTGQLSRRLYLAGCEITALDFSARMLAKAKEQMPKARLLLHDFSKGDIQSQLEDYHAVILTYSIHHLDPQKQLHLIRDLAGHLLPGGLILIGDVMTDTQDAMDKLAKTYESIWDDEEYYPVYETYKRQLPGMKIDFIPLSESSGVMSIAPAQRKPRLLTDRQNLFN